MKAIKKQDYLMLNKALVGRSWGSNKKGVLPKRLQLKVRMRLRGKLLRRINHSNAVYYFYIRTFGMEDKFKKEIIKAITFLGFSFLSAEARKGLKIPGLYSEDEEAIGFSNYVIKHYVTEERIKAFLMELYSPDVIDVEPKSGNFIDLYENHLTEDHFPAEFVSDRRKKTLSKYLILKRK